MHIREEVFACTRACEHLLNSELTLTPDERSFLEYHLTEVAQHYLVTLPSIEIPPDLQRTNNYTISGEQSRPVIVV
jgi:hypothetical protein